MRGIRRTLVLALCLGLAPSMVRAVDQDKIDAAVKRGVKYLKSLQEGDGKWRHQETGATSLAALALLECDVPANDPVIQKAADYIRAQSPTITQVYSVSLAIMFLDRLGDSADIPLIE